MVHHCGFSSASSEVRRSPIRLLSDCVYHELPLGPTIIYKDMSQYSPGVSLNKSYCYCLDARVFSYANPYSIALCRSLCVTLELVSSR
jgi:hypothetical protein